MNNLTYVINAAIVAAFLLVLGALKVSRHPAMVQAAGHLGHNATTFVRIGLVEVVGTLSLVSGIALLA